MHLSHHAKFQAIAFFVSGASAPPGSAFTVHEAGHSSQFYNGVRIWGEGEKEGGGRSWKRFLFFRGSHIKAKVSG